MHSKALFISDLHLHPALQKTTRAFLDFLQNQCKQTEQLYILGDLFEYWAGDDDMDSDYVQTIIRSIRKTVDSGITIFWICGNRDFLTGERFLEKSGAKMLPDLSTIDSGNLRIALAHGDAQCTDDQAYMQFRKMVRNPAWQQQFLAMPLAQRKAIITGMRRDSQKGNQEKSDSIMDVNANAIKDLFSETGASVLIHGHTHKPGKYLHDTGNGKCLRLVLSDWNLDTDPVRGDWIELTQNGELLRHTVELI